MTTGIEALHRELDEWNFDGVEATFWWRDDDAQAPTAALEQLIDLAQKFHAPLALAVIPHGMGAALAPRLKARRAVAVLQHGFSHANHAPPTEKKAELGDHRAHAVIQQELTSGFAALRGAFGEQFIAALTPPWNRIAAPLVQTLAPMGFTGLSTFTARDAPEPAPGVRAVNTHVDLIDWKSGRRFIGADAAFNALAAHLRGRRLGQFDSAEPTGLLTHHLLHDAACWKFLAQLLMALDDHPAVKWKTAESLFVD